MKGLISQEYYSIEIVAQHDNGKWYESKEDSDTLIGVSRVLTCFVPKKGYKVIEIVIRKEEGLV